MSSRSISDWWKDQPKRDRSDKGARYALVISIDTPGVEMDIWTPVAQQVGLPVLSVPEVTPGGSRSRHTISEQSSRRARNSMGLLTLSDIRWPSLSPEAPSPSLVDWSTGSFTIRWRRSSPRV